MFKNRSQRGRELLLILTPLLVPVIWWGLNERQKNAPKPDTIILIPRKPRPSIVHALAFSTDRRILALADAGGNVRFWDLHEKRFTQKFKNDDYLLKVAPWASAKHLELSNGSNIRASKTARGGPKGLPAPSNPDATYVQIAQSRRGTLEALTRVDGEVTVRDRTANRHMFSANATDRAACGLAVAPDDSLIAVGNLILEHQLIPDKDFQRRIGTEIVVRNARSGKTLHTFRWVDSGITRELGQTENLGNMEMAFSLDSQLLSAVCVSGIATWEVRSGRRLYLVPDEFGSRHLSGRILQFSPNGRYLACASPGHICVRDARTGAVVKHSVGPYFVNALTFSLNSQMIAVGGQGKDRRGIAQILELS